MKTENLNPLKMSRLSIFTILSGQKEKKKKKVFFKISFHQKNSFFKFIKFFQRKCIGNEKWMKMCISGPTKFWFDSKFPSAQCPFLKKYSRSKYPLFSRRLKGVENLKFLWSFFFAIPLTLNWKMFWAIYLILRNEQKKICSVSHLGMKTEKNLLARKIYQAREKLNSI